MRHVRMLVLFVLCALIAASIAATTASAKKQTFIEQEEFKLFSQCPLENPESYDCIYSRTTSGIFQVGRLKVHIKNPIVLQGAIRNPLETGDPEIIPPSGGVVLTPTPQPVPGGINAVLQKTTGNAAFLKSCKENKESSECTVDGTAEKVGGPGEIFIFNFIGEQTPGVVLPLRLHLTGSILGENCYFGSSEHPVVIDFTTGETSPEPPNMPIHGSVGQIGENAGESLLYDNKYEIVQNGFEAPGAQGCGNGTNEKEIDYLLDRRIGVPAPDGFNSLQLFGEQAIAPNVHEPAQEERIRNA